MQQHVSLIVACDSSGRTLAKTIRERITSNGFEFDPVPLMNESHLAFYHSYVDLWSMRDTFDRFIYPKNALTLVEAYSTQVWTIPRAKMRIRNKARNTEEEILRSLLCYAKDIYKTSEADFYFFLIRSILPTTATSFDPKNEESIKI
jgi:hypothetical protein